MPDPFSRTPRPGDPFARSPGRRDDSPIVTDEPDLYGGDIRGQDRRLVVDIQTGRVYIPMADPTDEEYGQHIEVGARVSRLVVDPRASDPVSPLDGEFWVKTDGTSYIQAAGLPIFLGGSGTTAHPRAHAITGPLDHSATANRIFYVSNLGLITELALGADGTFLQSQGPTVAPSFAAVIEADIPATIARTSQLSGIIPFGFNLAGQAFNPEPG